MLLLALVSAQTSLPGVVRLLPVASHSPTQKASCRSSGAGPALCFGAGFPVTAKARAARATSVCIGFSVAGRAPASQLSETGQARVNGHCREWEADNSLWQLLSAATGCWYCPVCYKDNRQIVLNRAAGNALSWRSKNGNRARSPVHESTLQADLRADPHEDIRRLAASGNEDNDHPKARERAQHLQADGFQRLSGAAGSRSHR